MNTEQFFITHQNLKELLAGLLREGPELFAPVRAANGKYFSRIQAVDEIAFDASPTVESPKSMVFPRVERLISYERCAPTVAIEDASRAELPPGVVFGTRPCDAVGLKRLADFFAADISDAFVEKRRNRLTVVSMSCTEADADCFCTTVGLGPGDANGSDLLLTPVGDDRYYLECVTERGWELLKDRQTLLEPAGPFDKSSVIADLAVLPEFDGMPGRLATAFDHPLWKTTSLRCLGCGACAYVCPVCSCFDIEDEGTATRGDRLRCWDSCGLGQFTLHTSGHNPRPVQSDRWRQRFMHKFSYMPERFGFFGCVGCGRCSRSCPADMNIKEQIAITASGIKAQGGQ